MNDIHTMRECPHTMKPGQTVVMTVTTTLECAFCRHDTALAEIEQLRREVHECDTFHGNVKSQLDILRRQSTAADNDRDVAIAEASRLRALVVEAVDLAMCRRCGTIDEHIRLAAIRAEVEAACAVLDRLTKGTP